MFREPIDVSRALRTLREEHPSPEATARVLAAVRRPAPRPSLARPLAAAMIAAAILALVVLTPRAKAGSAWAQTLAATAEAPNVHIVSRWANGRKSMEEWRSGARGAVVLYTEDGRVQSEARHDGKRALNYFNWFKMSEFRHEKPAPNARSYAIVTNDRDRGRPFYEIPLGGVQVALNDPDVEITGHEEAKDGRPETYRLRHTIRLGGRPLGKPVDMAAEIDLATRRIRALVKLPRRFEKGVEVNRAEIDYPTSTPAAVFAPRAQAARVDATYDIDGENAAVQRTLRQGLGRRGPVTLRAAFLDGGGALWAYWTGAPATRTFATPGVPLEPGGRRNAYPSGLTGLGRTPKARVGDRIDLDVPYPGGVARFRRVPVRRIGLVNHVQGVLMAFRPPP